MLGNFVYSNPTRLYFGENALDGLSQELKNYGPNILLTYGGGSVKKSGLYDEIVAILKSAGKNIIELPGVMSNPTTEKLYEGVKLGRLVSLNSTPTVREGILAVSPLIEIPDTCETIGYYAGGTLIGAAGLGYVYTLINADGTGSTTTINYNYSAIAVNGCKYFRYSFDVDYLDDCYVLDQTNYTFLWEGRNVTRKRTADGWFMNMGLQSTYYMWLLPSDEMCVTSFIPIPAGCAKVRIRYGVNRTTKSQFQINAAYARVGITTPGTGYISDWDIASGAVYLRLQMFMEDLDNCYIYDLTNQAFIWKGANVTEPI